jgi:hypothetical protein
MSSDFQQFLEEEGYISPRLLPTGEWAAICQQMYTTALVVGLDREGYRIRFCFENPLDAVVALHDWDGSGFPPGYWLKRKGEGGDLTNPERKS